MKAYEITLVAAIMIVLAWLLYLNNEAFKNGKFENGHRWIHVKGNRGWVHDPDCHCQLTGRTK